MPDRLPEPSGDRAPELQPGISTALLAKWVAGNSRFRLTRTRDQLQ